LPTTRHCCNLDTWALGLGAKPLVTPKRVLSEYNEDLILIFLRNTNFCF